MKRLLSCCLLLSTWMLSPATAAMPVLQGKPKKEPPAAAQPQDPKAPQGADGEKGKKGKDGEKGKDGAAAAEGAWMTDYKAALERAKKEKKVILADFTGSDWCVWCQRLDKEVFTTPEFEKWAAKNVILLQLDFPRQKELAKELREQNDKLKKEHKIQGFPTVLFLNAKGEKVGEYGYDKGGPDVWLKKADKLLAKAKG